MATITNKTDGLEVVDSHGDTYFIKYNNVKLIKSSGTVSIYDNSENRRGADALKVTHAEVTSPTTTDLNDLYTTIRTYID
tara:strand:+ start:477 stop:716 length:240 start_codon:yes stop_codon:yes gene_type:complete